MPDSKVSNEPSLIEKRQAARRSGKKLKRAAAAKSATTRAQAAAKRAAARRAAKLAGAKRAAARPTAPGKDWLRAPVQITKVQPSTPLGARRPGAVLPTTQQPSLGALRRARPAPVGGEWNGIELIPVISSNVGSYGYDDEEQMLVIQFLDGSIYEYYGVPESVWFRFQAAPSKGKFVWSDVRDKFAYERVA